MLTRVLGRVLLGASVVAAAWLLWPRSPVAGMAAQPADPQPVGAAEGKLFGVASCSSMACHHFNGPQGSARSEYSTWSGWDKHTKAYAVLMEERSDRMVRNLHGEGAKKAIETELCLKCHATTHEGKTTHVGERYQLADGVGCESCHGPSEKWLTTHYTNDFLRLTPKEKESRYGLWNTKDLSRRIQICSSCHVGDGSREVNHDLIAAGHPRLNFEAYGFHQIYARHWPREAELQRHPDFEARLWALGQLSAARSSVELLKSRADGADREGPAARPWPEFAEYTCFACHKNLQVDSPRQRSDYYKKRHPGSFPFGNWYLSMSSPLEAQLGGAGLAEQFKGLRGQMEQPAADARKVSQQATQALGALNHLIGKVHDKKQFGRDELKVYLKNILDDGIKRLNDQSMDWDEATQYYLSVAALHQSLVDLKEPGADDKALHDGLKTISKRLRAAFPKGTDSPQLFNPDAAPKLSTQFEGVRKQLGN